MLFLQHPLSKPLSVKAALLSVCFSQMALLVACSAEPSPQKNTDKATATDPQKPQAQVLKIAAAANLSSVLPTIIDTYKNSEGTESNVADKDRKALQIDVTYASSGKLYAQIKAGAPYDIFLAANQDFPAKLVRASSQLSTYKPFTYTQGQLAWYSTLHPMQSDDVIIPNTPSPDVSNTHLTLPKPLTIDSIIDAKITIANPQLAPYGASAQVYLQQLGVYDKLRQQHHIIQAENISQTFQYAHSGSVDYGLVAKSQLIAASVKPSQYQTLAPNTYPPILQDGIVLNDKPISKDFAHFLQTPETQQQFAQAGYLPVSQ